MMAMVQSSNSTISSAAVNTPQIELAMLGLTKRVSYGRPLKWIVMYWWGCKIEELEFRISMIADGDVEEVAIGFEAIIEESHVEGATSGPWL